jgi:hypothetical protein
MACEEVYLHLNYGIKLTKKNAEKFGTLPKVGGIVRR